MEKLDAICMQLIAIGEALKNLDKITNNSLLPNYPQIDWKKVKGMRDIISHHYFDIDAEAIYTVCADHIKLLSQVIDKIGQDVKADILDWYLDVARAWKNLPVQNEDPLLLPVEDLNCSPNIGIEPKDYFEIASKMRKQVSLFVLHFLYERPPSYLFQSLLYPVNEIYNCPSHLSTDFTVLKRRPLLLWRYFIIKIDVY